MIMVWKKELIGSSIEIVESKNQSLVGFKGTIIDETKNSLLIKNGKIKRILKSHVKIKIGDKIIDGKKILKSPENRK
jgi:RNase P/RNase MRP subunit p29